MITSPISRPITSRIASAIAGARQGGVWSPADLFRSGEAGALYLAPIANVSTDTGGTTGAESSGDAAKHIADLSGNDKHATGDGSQTYQVGWDYGEVGVEYIDNRSGNLAVTLADLGSSATRVVVRWGEIEILESQTISGATSLPQDEFVMCLYIDRALTDSEKAKIQRAYSNQLRVVQGAVLHADFTENRFYWNDEVRAITDLTYISGNSYYLDAVLDVSGECALLMEFEYDDPTSIAATGTFFSWTTGSKYPTGKRFEAVEVTGTGFPRVYHNQLSGAASYLNLNFRSKAGEGGGFQPLYGVHRAFFKASAGEAAYSQSNNNDYQPDPNALVIGTTADATRIGFQCRAWAPGTPDALLTDGTLRRVTVFNSGVGEILATNIGRYGVGSPIHLIGDSFLNSYALYMELYKLANADTYTGISQDGVGATSLVEHAVRFASNNSKWHDSTLVIVDGGLSDDTEDAIDAINDMVARLSHNRWIYLEPAPNVATGEAGRAEYDAKVAAIAAEFPDNFVETLAPAQAESDGSGDDIAEVAKDLWPLSLKISIVDFHPNAAGQAFLAGVIHDALVTRGWA